MKGGTTHLAHKAEHAVDLGGGAGGAVLAVTPQAADRGDTDTLLPTVGAAVHNLRALADDPETGDNVTEDLAAEVVTDKGYHSNATMTALEELEVRL
jgi:transposase